MSESIAMWPKSIQLILKNQKVAVEDALVLKFDEQWNWIGYIGELANFALAGSSEQDIVELVRALCAGLPRVKGAHLKHVCLPNGAMVDLHLTSQKKEVLVLLLDARSEVEQTRVWQQSAQESELRSYEKTREIRKHRVKLSDVKLERDELAWQLASMHARWAQLRSELTVRPLISIGEVAATFDRLEVALDTPQAPGPEKCALVQLSNRIQTLLPAQVQLSTEQSSRSIPGKVENWASTFLPMLMFAHRRAGVENEMISASLSHHGSYLLLSAYCGKNDLTPRESRIAWESKLSPEVRGDDLLPAEFLLVQLAELQKAAARLTRRFEPSSGLWLNLSVPLQIPEAPSQLATERGRVLAHHDSTRIKLAIGALIWVVSDDVQAVDVVHQALGQRGLQIAVRQDCEQLLANLASAKPALMLLDPKLRCVKPFAFAARSQGFAGKIIALRPLTGGAAVAASFDASCDELTVNAIQRHVLG